MKDEKTPFLKTEKSSHHDGSSSATAPPSYENTRSRSKFAVISFHMTDRIRLLQFPPQDVHRIHDMLASVWQAGIQHCKPYNASTEIKLKTNPWSCGPPENAKSFKLATNLLSQTYEMGWLVEHEVTICKKEGQKGVFS